MKLVDDYEAIKQRLDEIQEGEPKAMTMAVPMPPCARCGYNMREYTSCWICTHCASVFNKGTVG